MHCAITSRMLLNGAQDDTLPEQGISDDEVERKIAEEHAKYREAQAKRQEEVRA